MTGLIDVANIMQTRRHYARIVNALGAGVSLCSEGLHCAVEVYDQQGLERLYPPKSRRGGALDVTELPLCRNCAAKAVRA